MTYMFILKCALKLVLKNILYYDARSEKHQTYYEASLYAVFSDFTSSRSGLVSLILYSDLKDPHTTSSVYVTDQLSESFQTIGSLR